MDGIPRLEVECTGADREGGNKRKFPFITGTRCQCASDQADSLLQSNETEAIVESVVSGSPLGIHLIHDLYDELIGGPFQRHTCSRGDGPMLGSVRQAFLNDSEDCEVDTGIERSFNSMTSCRNPEPVIFQGFDYLREVCQSFGRLHREVLVTPSVRVRLSRLWPHNGQ